jgi:hypothetical protein
VEKSKNGQSLIVLTACHAQHLIFLLVNCKPDAG